jgi:MFS family permease
MDKFKLDFGERLENGTYDVSATNQSLFSSIIQAGEFVGSLSAAFVGDFLGRRGSLQTAVVISSVGAILQIIVAGSVPLLVVGRLVLGIGIGIVSNCAPLYLSEIPHASVRGSVVAGWQLLLAIGQVCLSRLVLSFS